MPSSHFNQLSEIVELIVSCDPKTILDIGIGFGKYGFLSREYLELWDGRYQYDNWKRQIDGIEVYKKYITPIHNLIYDRIFQGNAIDILPTLKTKYDLILLIDTLEHFSKDEGSKILSQCLQHGRNVIISTPKDIGNQKDSFGNIFETHRFQWKEIHFNKFSDKLYIPNKKSLIYFIGEDKLQVEKKLKSLQLNSKKKSWIVKRFRKIRKN